MGEAAMKAFTPETAAIATNPGRVADVKAGRKFHDIPPAPVKNLPSPAFFAEGFALHRAGIDAALEALNVQQETMERVQEASVQVKGKTG
jgi:hypothetical protein